MQTFLPYPDFAESLKALDYKRLGKQRVESLQLINIIEKLQNNPNQKIAWMNHPACLMWKDHLDALKYYYNLSVCLWVLKGYNNTMRLKDFYVNGQRYVVSHMTFVHSGIPYFQGNEMYRNCEKHIIKPSFIGNEEFHLSHQSNLIRKFPEHYKPQFPNIPDNLPYVWPKG